MSENAARAVQAHWAEQMPVADNVERLSVSELVGDHAGRQSWVSHRLFHKRG